MAIPHVAGPFFLSQLSFTDKWYAEPWGSLFIGCSHSSNADWQVGWQISFSPPNGQMLVWRQQFLYSVAKNECHINVAEVDERASRTVGWGCQFSCFMRVGARNLCKGNTKHLRFAQLVLCFFSFLNLGSKIQGKVSLVLRFWLNPCILPDKVSCDDKI